MRKIIIIFMLLLTMYSVSAELDWLTWGNYNRGRTTDTVFSSSFPQGTLNFTKFEEVKNIKFPPLVADLDQDNINEVIIVTPSNIVLLDNEFNTILSYPFDAETNPVITNYDDDNYREISIIEDNGNVDKFKILEYDGESLTEVVSYDNIARSEYVLAYSDLDSDYVFYRNLSGNPVRLDITTGTEKLFTMSGASLTFEINGSYVEKNSQNHYAIVDIENDGLLDIWRLGVGAGSSCRLEAMRVIDNATSYTNTLLESFSANPDVYVASGNIGFASGLQEIITLCQDDTTQEGEINIIDSDHNTVFTYNTGVGADNTLSFPVTSDINFDGLLEFCFLETKTGYTDLNTSLKCYNSQYNSLFNVSYPYPSNEYRFFSIGEFTEQNNTYMEFIFPDGIYYYDNNNLTLMYDFDSATNNKVMTYPVAVRDRVNINKDILRHSTAGVSLFSTIPSAICGNGVLEFGETILTCYEDYIISDPDIQPDVLQGYCADVEIRPSPFNVWQNGTRVQVKVTPSSEDDTSNVRARVWLYFGEDNEYDSGYSAYVPKDTTLTFETFANYTTTSSTLKVRCENALNPSVPQLLTYQFNVQLEGDEFGDSVFLYNNPIAEEGDPSVVQDTNSIDNAVDTMFGLTGLSRLVIWIFIMFMFAGATFYYGLQNKWTGLVVSTIVITGEVLLLILGTLLGYVPLGVIIFLTIIGILIGTVTIRRMITGA